LDTLSYNNPYVF